MKGHTAAIDALEKQFLAYAYASFAMMIRDTFKAGFGAFVAILPCETGITQFSAAFTSALPSVSGVTLASAKSTGGPILGWVAEPSHAYRMPKRLSAETIPNPDAVKVQMSMPNIEAIARQLMASNTRSVSGVATAARNAYDEPEMRAWLADKGVGDVNVLTIHSSQVIANFTNGFQGQYRKRSQFKNPDIQVIKSLAK